MKKIITLILMLYYLAGLLLLPMGNFSVLTNLPDMYRNCKATEEADMGPLDFIKDHLINIDSIFDAHDHGDDQKPHEPVTFSDSQVQAPFPPIPFKVDIGQLLLIESSSLTGKSDNYFFWYSKDIFHPPIDVS